jgi:MerR family redox-sensitive transcriptional activator SoxR
VADQKLLSISEVAEATGLQTSALRYYESEGLIVPAARLSGRRQYDPLVLQRLAAIALLQDAGFTIAEIAQLLGPEASRQQWQAMAEQRLRDIDTHMARVAAARELLAAALRCDCAGLDTCGLVSERRGRHRRVLQTLSSRRPADRPA